MIDFTQMTFAAMMIYGQPVHSTIHATRLVRSETRVRGGYMNRWLIRRVEESQVPCAFLTNDGVIYAHPEIVAKLRDHCLKVAGSYSISG